MVIKHGIPFDVAHCMTMGELMGYAITFAQLENGKEWDWERMTFIDGGR
jgi:hypothetical protein